LKPLKILGKNFIEKVHSSRLKNIRGLCLSKEIRSFLSFKLTEMGFLQDLQGFLELNLEARKELPAPTRAASNISKDMTQNLKPRGRTFRKLQLRCSTAATSS
jgi:hypothetical protein